MMLTASSNNLRVPAALDCGLQIQSLDNGHKEEVLGYLAANPLDTFIMSSWIRDNGLASSFNRGTFYGSRNAQGRLQGVALIGHITLFNTEEDAAVAAFAHLTKNCPSARTVLGGSESIDQFLRYYTPGAVKPRLVAYESLFQKSSTTNVETVECLRPATSAELDLIVPIHAQLAFEESGVNPLDVDPAGFRERCARRTNQGRVWVALEDGELHFKADVVSDTPDVIYLEGVYVSPEHRGNGYGARCITQLTNHLLQRTEAVCLMVNQDNSAAQACYRKAGFDFQANYQTLFLQQQQADQN